MDQGVALQLTLRICCPWQPCRTPDYRVLFSRKRRLLTAWAQNIVASTGVYSDDAESKIEVCALDQSHVPTGSASLFFFSGRVRRLDKCRPDSIHIACSQSVLKIRQRRTRQLTTGRTLSSPSETVSIHILIIDMDVVRGPRAKRGKDCIKVRSAS